MAKTLICTQCGHVGKPKRIAKGSLGVEIVLWLCFLIPGLIYSVWRSSSYHPACAKCESTDMIPVDSPRAKKILQEMDPEKSIDEVVAQEKQETAKKNKIYWVIISVFVVMVVWGLISLAS